jgi:hypothetical protein
MKEMPEMLFCFVGVELNSSSSTTRKIYNIRKKLFEIVVQE